MATKPTAKTVKPASKPAPSKAKVASRPAAGAQKAGPGSAAARSPASGAKSGPAATVTLKHMAASLADSHAMQKKQAEGVLGDVIEMIVAHLKKGERIRMAGLGILEVKSRAARMGRNPATGAAIQIKASRKIAFRPAKELKEAV